MSSDHDRLLTIAHEAVDHAVELFSKPTEHELTFKGDRDYATETDYRIERELRERLAKLTSEIGFLGEEDGHIGSEERYWCLDPIDGTVNYVHGNPFCGISLALVETGAPVTALSTCLDSEIGIGLHQVCRPKGMADKSTSRRPKSWMKPS